MNLALFDFDGTITTREMFPDFIRRAVPPRRLLYGKVLLAPLILGYRFGLVPGTVVRAAIVRVGFRGIALDRVEAHARDFAQHALPAVVRPQVLERIRWHQARGDTVVVVSGAFDLYLAPWCEHHRLALISSSLEHRDGVLTGRYRGAQCVRGEKARRVRAAYALDDYDSIFAYGDTPEDRELLALADRRTYRGVEQPATAR